MKALVLLMTLSVHALSFATDLHEEFDPKEEMNCHKEIKNLGCLKSHGQVKADCVAKNLGQLSQGCQTMHKQKLKHLKP
jgi:hypothetical protein